MKKVRLAVTVMAVIPLLGGWALAHGPRGGKTDQGPGSGYGYYSNLTSEQQEKLQSLERSFHQDTAEVRGKLHQTTLELQGLWSDPKTDPEKIRAKQREVFELQRQLKERALEHRLAIREVVPEQYFGCGPWGHGLHKGPGPWTKRGHMWAPGSGPRKGYGGGFCW